MAQYEVILFTHVARLYRVEADTKDEAEEIAEFQYAEEGNDGEVLYDDIDEARVSEAKKT